MKMDEIYSGFGDSTENMCRAVFSSIFILQNRIQTACEKLQTQISMKQWLLIAMALSCPEPRTLTGIGELMGCSRQNVKKLALALESKGFVTLSQGSNNSVQIELTQRAQGYFTDIAQRQSETVKLLFSEFGEQEIHQLFRLYAKLYAGIEKVESYAEKNKSTDK